MDSPAVQIEMEEPISPKQLLASLQIRLDALNKRLHDLDDRIEDMPKPTMRGQIGFGKKSQPSETDARNLAELKKLFKELELEAEGVSYQMTEIRLREQKKENAMVLIPELIVIAFVNELEKADQYFDFKEYLKEKDNITDDSSEIDVVEELLKEETREKFDKLDKEVIGHAVHAHILEKRVEHAPARRLKYIEYLKELDSEKWEWGCSNVNNNRSKFTEEYYNEKAGSWPLLELGPEEIDEYAFTNPICNLVFRTRQKLYVMDQDPKEELKNIEELDSMFFRWYIRHNFPRNEFEKIMSTYKDTSREEALVRVRTELYKKALERYNAFTNKYAGSQTKDIDNPSEDELMSDRNWKRSSGESSQPLRSVRTRTTQ